MVSYQRKYFYYKIFLMFGYSFKYLYLIFIINILKINDRCGSTGYPKALQRLYKYTIKKLNNIHIEDKCINTTFKHVQMLSYYVKEIRQPILDIFLGDLKELQTKKRSYFRRGCFDEPSLFTSTYFIKSFTVFKVYKKLFSYYSNYLPMNVAMYE